MDAWSSSYTTKVWKWFLHHGSVEGCIELVGYVEYHKGSYAMEVQSVVPSRLASLSTIKDSYVVDAWSSSYTTKVWKCFWRCGNAEGCFKLVVYIEYRKGSYAVETRSVVSSWLEALSTINWLH